MSPEERELLEKSVALAEENNEMLHSIIRSMRFSRIMKTVYWVVIISSAVGISFWFLPKLDTVILFLKELFGVYNSVSGDIEKIASSTIKMTSGS